MLRFDDRNPGAFSSPDSGQANKTRGTRRAQKTVTLADPRDHEMWFHPICVLNQFWAEIFSFLTWVKMGNVFCCEGLSVSVTAAVCVCPACDHVIVFVSSSVCVCVCLFVFVCVNYVLALFVFVSVSV